MVSESIQPLSAIGPVDGDKNEDKITDPAKRDYIKGREFYTAGDYAQAAHSFHNALKGFEEQSDEQGIANASDRLGDTCLARGENEWAIENYQRAYAICEKEDDSFSQLAINKKLAVAFKRQGEFEKSLEIVYDMLEHYRLINNPQGAVEALEVIAEVFIEQGEQGKAADTYRTIAGIHTNFSHKRLAEDFTRRADELEQG